METSARGFTQSLAAKMEKTTVKFNSMVTPILEKNGRLRQVLETLEDAENLVALVSLSAAHRKNKGRQRSGG